MGLRFQRRVTLFPGVRLNFSRRGISTTIGPRGASLNFGRSGTTLNVGVPGTGLSLRKKLTQSPPSGQHAIPPVPAAFPVPAPEPASESGAREIGSAPAAEVTTDGLEPLKRLIIEARAERQTLRAKLPSARQEARRAERRVQNAKHWLWKRFVGKHLQEREADLQVKAKELSDLEERLEGAVIDIDFGLNEAALQSFRELSNAFTELVGAERIWDVTAEVDENRRATRSAADTNLAMTPVRLALVEDDLLHSDTDVLRFPNANGPDLLIYPAFLMTASGNDFGLVDLREVALAYRQGKFVETREVPSDATVVDYTWAKVNKNGTPDKRFKGNYRIPLVGYGHLLWVSPGGIRERYMVSSAEKAERFYLAFLAYQKELRALLQELRASEVDANTPRQIRVPTALPPAPRAHDIGTVPLALPPVRPERSSSVLGRLAIVAGLFVVAYIFFGVRQDLRQRPGAATANDQATSEAAPTNSLASAPTAPAATLDSAVASRNQAKVANTNAATQQLDALKRFKSTYGLPDSDRTEISKNSRVPGAAHRYFVYMRANVKVHWVRDATNVPWQISDFEELKPRRMLAPDQALERLQNRKRRPQGSVPRVSGTAQESERSDQ